MCGIFAYIGKDRNATEAVLDGLKQLDYRGYDSWGISILKGSKLLTQKYVGVTNEDLLSLPESSISIGHTRWATCGGVTQTNAHPHYASDKSFVLAHNGIVENFENLKKMLIKKRFHFVSDTDTEVIVRLIENELSKNKDFITALRKAFKKCMGRNTIIILKDDGEVVAIRNGSPLVIGLSKRGEVYFSSDTLSFSSYVEKVITLDNGQIATYKNNKLNFFSMKTGQKIEVEIGVNKQRKTNHSKGKFKHYMLKEIYDQPTVINNIAAQNKERLNDLAKLIKESKNVYCIGSGTAGAAAYQMAYYLRTFGNVNVIGLVGAEAKDYFKLFGKNDLIIALSQSGETADVLEVLEFAKRKGVSIASFVNMHGSLMTKISDLVFMAEAGPEICVMSTKVFVAQIAWGYLAAKTVQGKFDEGVQNLKTLAQALNNLLRSHKNETTLNTIAEKLVNSESLFLLGKGQNLQIVKEGMVKIIEGSYIHAHAIPAGDLKHYAITLMEKGINVIAVSSLDENLVDTLNAIHEIKARGANIIGVSSKDSPFFDDFVKVRNLKETSAILNIVPLQLLAYKLALLKGNNIDKPRNIAKSVTVK